MFVAVILKKLLPHTITHTDLALPFCLSYQLCHRRTIQHHMTFHRSWLILIFTRLWHFAKFFTVLTRDSVSSHLKILGARAQTQWNMLKFVFALVVKWPNVAEVHPMNQTLLFVQHRVLKDSNHNMGTLHTPNMHILSVPFFCVYLLLPFLDMIHLKCSRHEALKL